MDWSNVISAILNVISVTSAIATVVALRFSLQQTREIQQIRLSLSGEIQQIQLSLSTRYIGEFPDYFPDIVNLIKDAKEEIIICCNFATSGIISVNDQWLEYRNALEERMVKGRV